MRRLIASLGVAGLMLAASASPALAKKPSKTVNAQRLCERNDGTFINVSPVAYACLLPSGATAKEIQQAGRVCKRQGGFLFAAVGNVVYACVLPGVGGTLPPILPEILDPVSGLPLDTGGLLLIL